MDRTHSSINSLLEQATCIARRSKEAAGETESTKGYKRRQTEELIKFANDNGLWIDLSHLNITYMDRGGENEVFHDGNVSVVKLNNFEYAGDDLENFFIRIAAHNKFFGNVPYQMIGFAYNSQQEFCAVLVQPYILAEREATEDEIAAYMQALGFEMDYYDEYHNSDYEVFDLLTRSLPIAIIALINNRLQRLTGMQCSCFIRYDRYNGPYALRCSVRRFFISSCSRGNDGIPGYR